jgi:hypothetical protein
LTVSEKLSKFLKTENISMENDKKKLLHHGFIDDDANETTKNVKERQLLDLKFKLPILKVSSLKP